MDDALEDVAALFPFDLSGEVVALRACIDASNRENSFYSVAVVAYGFDRAIKANREWEALLDGRTFHMTDLHARRGDFKGISDSEVERIMRGTVSVIRRHASFVMATSCIKNLIEPHMPRTAGISSDSKELLSAFRSVYGLMSHLAMYAVGSRAGNASAAGTRQISYVFEAGDVGQAGFVKFIEFLQNNPGREVFLDGYSLNRHTISSKGNMEPIFHSADLVAWEWAKHVERTSDGLRMRGSLRNLSDVKLLQDTPDEGLRLSNGETVFFRHYGTAQIMRVVEFWKATIAAQSVEDVRIAIQRWQSCR